MPSPSVSPARSDSEGKKLKRSYTEEDMERALRLRQLTLFRRPLATLGHFAGAVWDLSKRPVRWLRHPRNMSKTLPAAVALLAVAVAHHVDGPHSEPLARAVHYFWYTLWWFGLGVFSSIGLGTGAHTGSLFLFPHICAVVRTAERRRALDFDHTQDMWSLSPKLADAFVVPDARASAGAAPTYWELYHEIFYAVVVWGVGTALGELPPYLVSYSASVAGVKDEEFEELLNAVEGKPKGSGPLAVALGAFHRLERFMIDFLQHHGFWGVLLMASYPNALFDMCGLCCGHFQMPMWSFLAATIIGKGLIKAPMQGVVMVYIFRESGRQEFLAAVKDFLSLFSVQLGVPACLALAILAAVLFRSRQPLRATSAAAAALFVLLLTVAEAFQERLDVTGKLESGVNKALVFCDKSLPAQGERSWVQQNLSPKALFSNFVLLIVLYFVQDLVSKAAQHHAAEADKK